MRRAVGRRSAPVSTRRARMRTLPGALNTQRNATRVPPVTPQAPVPLPPPPILRHLHLQLLQLPLALIVLPDYNSPCISFRYSFSFVKLPACRFVVYFQSCFHIWTEILRFYYCIWTHLRGDESWLTYFLSFNLLTVLINFRYEFCFKILFLNRIISFPTQCAALSANDVSMRILISNQEFHKIINETFCLLNK